MPYHSRKPVRMSLAAALEEERLELAGELEARNAASRRNQSATTTRSFQDAAPSPESPETLPPRHGSIAGIGVGVTPPVGRRNWHDPAPVAPSLRVNTAVAAAPPPATTTATATTAPATTATATTAPQPTSEPEKSFGQSAATTTTRRFSDNAALDKKKLADAQADSKTSHSAATSPVASKPKPSIRWDDSVVMSPSATSYSLNRRANRSADKSNKPPQSKNAMAAVMSGLDLKVGLPSFTRGRDSSRNNTQRGTSLDSRLSTSRLGRSSSPRNRWLGSSSRNSSTNPGKPAPEKSKLVESANAEKPQATPTPAPAPAPIPASVQSGETADADRKPSTSGDERLEKDMYDSENNPIETSDEEADDSSSSDDDSSTERGRKPSVDIILPARSNSSGSAKTGPPPLPVGEKENVEEKSDYSHSSKQGPIPKKADVHPRTSFDSAASIPNTPFGSDDEAELSDIKRAQQLGIQMSSIDSSVQSRSIRTIIRGDYAQQSGELDGGRRRQRKYLVATDLSEESVYALEWVIGTILRDGDTMFAVCAIHDETAASNPPQVGDNAKAMQDAAAVIGSQTEETAQKPHNDSSTNLSRAILGRLGTGTDSKPGSVDARGMSKIESERVHAVEVISQTCVRLLRKTLLQVRVAVEAIHCKSPKHMITEAIDGLDPTLVIVGARGRSALKGVLLGSFSNYLVMHSSVPVMVARKKLKKHSKNKKTTIRLSNNLSAPKKLAYAKVD